MRRLTAKPRRTPVGTSRARWNFCALAATALLVCAACGGSSANGDDSTGAPDPASYSRAAVYDVEYTDGGLIEHHIDLDRNGMTDVIKTFVALDGARNPIADPQSVPDEDQTRVMVRKRVDVNQDGDMDVDREYNNNGVLISEQMDRDYDGVFELTLRFSDGYLARKEVDRDGDGSPEIIRYFAEGKMTRVEEDTDGDGEIDVWRYYENGSRLVRAGFDYNGDGRIDDWVRRDNVTDVASSTTGGDDGDSDESGGEEDGDESDSGDSEDGSADDEDAEDSGSS